MIQSRGIDKLFAKLKRLETAAAGRAMRKAVRRAASVLLRAVKESTPVDEGLLRRMHAYKISGKGRGLVMGAVIGADVAKLKAAEAAKLRPSNIDWLVEEGHRAPDGTFVPPTGFMRKAEAAAMPEAESTFERTLKAEIEAEAAK